MKGNKDGSIFGYRERKAVERKTDGKTGEDVDIEKNSQQKEGQTEKWTEEYLDIDKEGQMERRIV